MDSDEDLTENQLAQQSIYHTFLRCYATAKKFTTHPQGINLGTIRAKITPFHTKKGWYTYYGSDRNAISEGVQHEGLDASLWFD